MRDRTPINLLELQGSPNLQRAKKREDAERNAAPLTAEAQGEIEQLNVLIARAMSACRRGQTVNGKPNPAFLNLSSLIKSRDLLMRGRKPAAKSARQILDEANAMLAAPAGEGVN